MRKRLALAALAVLAIAAARAEAHDGLLVKAGRSKTVAGPLRRGAELVHEPGRLTVRARESDSSLLASGKVARVIS